MQTIEEILRELIDDFVNETGSFLEWKKFVKQRGYSLEELGFDDE